MASPASGRRLRHLTHSQSADDRAFAAIVGREFHWWASQPRAVVRWSIAVRRLVRRYRWEITLLILLALVVLLDVVTVFTAL